MPRESSMPPSPGLDLQQIWRPLPEPVDDEEALRDYLRGGALDAVYSKADWAIENIIDAVPTFPEAPLSTISIWHLSARPKPPYTATVRFLKNWAGSDDQLERIGGAVGPQFYRWIPDEWMALMERASRVELEHKGLEGPGPAVGVARDDLVENLGLEPSEDGLQGLPEPLLVPHEGRDSA